MAPTPSLEDIVRIAALDPVVAAQRTVCGPLSPYTLDCVVRRYRGLTLADYLQDTGLDPSTPEVVIRAGIGILTLTPDATCFSPLTESPEPFAADSALRVEREILCGRCDRHTTRCTAAGCDCTGLGQPSRLSSRCPLGLWRA